MGSASGSNAGVSIRIISETQFDINPTVVGSVPGVVTTTILNTWNSVAMTKAAGSGSYLIYVNGVSINGSAPQTPNFTNAIFRLGADQNGANIFNGHLAFAGIWNVLLTTAEILAMHRTLTVPATASQVLYRLSEGTGTAVTDYSGNANNGTLANITWTAGQVPNGVRPAVASRSAVTGRVTASGRAVL